MSGIEYIGGVGISSVGGETTVSLSNGVDDGFDRIGETSRQKKINKGQVNSVIIRPQILSEHCGAFDFPTDKVTPTNIVGQVFKASRDNINSVSVVIETTGLSESSLNNFDQYADNAALQLELVAQGSTVPSTLDTNVVSPNYASVNSAKLDVNDEGDKWVYSFAPINVKNGLLTFDFYVEKLEDEFVFEISDGVNFAQIPINPNLKESWQTFNVNTSAFVGVNLKAVTKICIICVKAEKEKAAYIDNIRYSTSSGNLICELYDFGTTIPTDAVSKISDATQYTQIGDLGITGVAVSSYNISLRGGKNLYHLENFICGAAKEIPFNQPITENNYYALVFRYVDIDATLYGSNPILQHEFYNNGFAFNCPDLTTPINSLGAFHDISFGIFASQDVFLLLGELKLDAVANSDASILFMSQNAEFKNTVYAINERNFGEELKETFDFRPQFLEDGTKVAMIYTDGATDNVHNATIEIRYLYEELPTHG